MAKYRKRNVRPINPHHGKGSPNRASRATAKSLGDPIGGIVGGQKPKRNDPCSCGSSEVNTDARAGAVKGVGVRACEKRSPRLSSWSIRGLVGRS